MVVHFNPAAQTTDVVHTLRHKTELAGLLVHNYKLKTGVPLNVTFAVKYVHAQVAVLLLDHVLFAFAVRIRICTVEFQ